MTRNHCVRVATIACAMLVAIASERGNARAETAADPTKSTIPPSAVRLYVFNCGSLEIADSHLSRFGLEPAEVAVNTLAIPCFLVAHPKGTLMWDPGAVPDDDWTPTGSPVKHRVVLPDSATRDVSITRPLKEQLAGIGYSPPDITYLALSHFHYDHTANANQFSAATWLVRQPDRDAMFSDKPPAVAQPATYSALRHSRTVIVSTDEHDVFGDGSVVLISAPGHTPGHQTLYVKLAKTGGVLLSGDLWHYKEQRKLDRVPTFDVDEAQTRASRKKIEAFLAKTGAQLWIQHDYAANSRLRKAPEYYE